MPLTTVQDRFVVFAAFYFFGMPMHTEPPTLCQQNAIYQYTVHQSACTHLPAAHNGMHVSRVCLASGCTTLAVLLVICLWCSACVAPFIVCASPSWQFLDHFWQPLQFPDHYLAVAAISRFNSWQLPQGATYQRVFKPQPAPVHLISALHQAHLGSLAEDSEEGSDLVSESDGGLIHDDDLPIELSPAASASLHQPSAQIAAGSSTNSGSAAKGHRAAAAAAGSDGMFELDINDDFEQAIGVSSFTAMGDQQMCPDLEAPDMQKICATPAAARATQSRNTNAALSQEPVSASLLVEGPQSSSSQAQHAQQAQYEQPQHTQQPVTESGQQPMPDSVPEAALSPLPILGPLPEAASLSAVATASQPRAAPVGDMTQVDLEEIELGEATGVPAQASAGQLAADEWEEVNLARAKETAVDAPSAAMPGDKVGPLF